MPLRHWHTSEGIQSAMAVTPSLTYMDWSALHCWPTAGFSLSDVHLCIYCMIPSSSKLRHCSFYTCLSCWVNLCCCPSKHSSVIASLCITFHPCCLHRCVSPYHPSSHTVVYEATADLCVWCSWSPHTVQRVV